MSIEKAATPFDIEVSPNPDEIAIEVPPLPGEPNTFDFGEDSPEDAGFYDNLADSVDAGALNTLASELLESYDIDLQSRKDWEKTYRDGLDLLGLKIEERTEPWDGACGAFHPILTEAAVRFQAESMMETFPAVGPVKTQIMGKITPQKEEQAQRVKEDMNYWLTTKMKDYRSEHERTLWSLCLAGSAFKKIYPDQITKRPRAMFVPAEDFVAPFGASDLWSCPRYTHIMRKTKNEIKKLIAAGFYIDEPLGEPNKDESALDKKKNKLTQQTPINDDRYVLLEMHIECTVPGFEDPDGIDLPYVVTINKSTRKIMSIYRNWVEEDEHKQKRMHFVHYPFVPGFGFYCYGWLHLIGGSAKSATSILRQLVDAGTLSNLPGGYKTRGLRIKSDDTPIAPGEFRDVDVMAGKIQDNIMTLPYKEPSQTLFQLLQFIVDAARQFVNIADMKMGDTNQETPVGTTLAILERSLKVISAIQARIHAAMREEFALLADIIRDNTPEEYDYDVEGGARQIKKADYSDVVDVIPVSDPNATTMAQRVAQYQSAIQLAQMAPNLYDQAELHREMLGVLGLKNPGKLIPSQDDMKPADPVTENMAILNNKPVKAFLNQDHESHIQAHMAFAQDPKIMAMVGQSPAAGQIKGAFAAHVLEHVGFAYRNQLEKTLGMPLPPAGEPLPPELEAQLSPLIAQAASKLLGKDVAEQQAQQIAQQQQDPVLQMQQKELEIKERDVARKESDDRMKLIMGMLDTLLKNAKSVDELAHKQKLDAAGVVLDAASTAADVATIGQQPQAPSEAQ